MAQTQGFVGARNWAGRDKVHTSVRRAQEEMRFKQKGEFPPAIQKFKQGGSLNNFYIPGVWFGMRTPPFFFFFLVPRISLHSALCTHSVRSKLWCCRDVAQQRGFTRSILCSTRVSYQQAVAPTRTYCHLHSLLGSSKVGRVLLSLSGTWHVPCCTLKPPNTVFEA